MSKASQGRAARQRARPRRRGPSSRAARPAVIVSDVAITDHAPQIRALLLHFEVRPDDADDLVQEVLTGAWRSVKAGRFRPRPERPVAEALQGWLYGVAWRYVNHYRRKAWRRNEIPVQRLRARLGRGTPSLEDRYAAWELLQGLDRLPRWASEILVLHYADGYDTRELSGLIKLGLRAVQIRIARARRDFRDQVQR